ncbi:hypothetical protein BDW02DRAFT_596107 [Decorospora gaudefroyi]|uniref:Uncharacterized protein n=1 Tax=Decorospora gaudefroyi TaxID=184978 RepID=A0A6A5KNI7_9PLEO|nr:hypothetical protein BDW02DRAFT_596107 [Decorospora gaudefroyi]
MKLINRLLHKHINHEQDSQPKAGSIPRLIRSPIKGKKQTVKPQPQARVLEAFDDPALPKILLRPATPPDGGTKLEDRIFERSRSVFILREPKPQQHRSSTGAVAGHLHVPSSKRLKVEEDNRATVPRGVTTSDREELDDVEGLDVHLDAECELDYRTYMVGLE